MNADEIVPFDSRYVPLTQQRYCCVPACIQMVMLRQDIALFPAELIAYHLGLLIPPEDRELYWHAQTGEKPLAGYGTRIYLPEFDPNKMFKELEIPLQLELYLIDEFRTAEDVVEYLKKTEEQNGDVLLCFDWGTLFDEDQHNGHVCVFDRVLDHGVRIIDPAYRSPKWRIVEPEKLYTAMKAHGPERSGGLWELSKESQ